MFLSTTRFQRGKLPHWEVDEGRYFITVRLADSLPAHVVLRLQEIHRSLSALEPQSAAFAAGQRQYFLAMEKYLNAGTGACILREDSIASVVVGEFQTLSDWHVDVPHYTIMPNHWHALLVPKANCVHPLGEIMKRLKGRSGLKMSRAIGLTGAIWQREWFDRWMRTEAEWEKTVAYIRQNPVKAGLVSKWQDHRWTK